ncbi:hypothetical protein T12_3143 [Trichinella patagoniensis]|uniref:Uncharacterized protein n=1 Tax=Trichinella patagoniensis TaxID=990121 RepID=A0A0V0YZY4_9BILA|nr:hypothetical protein T12_3143 [Trichinella patagoniensis]
MDLICRLRAVATATSEPLHAVFVEERDELPKHSHHENSLVSLATCFIHFFSAAFTSTSVSSRAVFRSSGGACA